jgi:nucleoid DNA-binding protein
MAKQSKAEKLLEKEIEKIYYANCSGIQISIMDIGKVFAAGKKAKLEGKDIKEAIVSFVETIRQN